jgi:hypothetical protein
MCALVIAGLWGQLGCASVDEGTETQLLAAETGTSLLPWKAGNRWTYRVTEADEVRTKETAILPEEAVGGSGPHRLVKANKVVTKKDDGDQTFSWQARVGERVVRYRENELKEGNTASSGEEHYDPAKLNVDESAAHTTLGAKWTEEYKETKVSKSGVPTTSDQSDAWTVEAVDESVTVPAGTFKAVVLSRTAGGAPKKFWFVRGVGKVKETDGPQTEELVSYQLAP